MDPTTPITVGELTINAPTEWHDRIRSLTRPDGTMHPVATHHLQELARNIKEGHTVAAYNRLIAAETITNNLTAPPAR